MEGFYKVKRAVQDMKKFAKQENMVVGDVNTAKDLIKSNITIKYMKPNAPKTKNKEACSVTVIPRVTFQASVTVTVEVFTASTIAVVVKPMSDLDMSRQEIK